MGAENGFLGLDAVRESRQWEPEVLPLMHGVGRVFLNAASRRRHAQALAFERSLMAALMENIPDAIYFKDRGSRFTRISRAQARLFGLATPDEALGKTDADFFTEEHAQQAFADEQQIILTSVPIVGKVEKETWPDREESWVSTTKMPLRNSDGEIIGTFGISRNITERKKLEQRLEQNARLLSEANEALKLRNQELDEFTYIASHDLQEPLRKLSAFSDLLREDLAAGNDDDVQHDIDVLAGAARRMQRLVQDLLALSRSGRQAMNFESLDLEEIADEALDTLELRIAETGAEIVRQALPKVPGDRTLLVQLYQNLIGNGLKFRGSATPRIELSAEPAPEGGWLLGVRDSGIGLKPEYAEQIFAPFKRLHGRDEYEGTGIGLAICRKIVERHGGRIWVESEPGQGAYFRFTLGKAVEGEST
jgi:PAS domain S-box-containing protein